VRQCDTLAGMFMPVVKDERKKKKGNQYTQEFLSKYYDSRGKYEALEERVTRIEASLTLSTEKQKEEGLIFPSDILEKLPLEVKKTVEGIMVNYERDFPDFCFWGMRKALIDAIRIRFRKDNKENMLYDENGNAYKLLTWIDLAKQQRYISPKQATNLSTQVKVFGDSASHDYMANLHKDEVPSIFTQLRMALGRMYYEQP
jgi:hypothetical protein